MRNYKIGIAIKEVRGSGQYERTVYASGFDDVDSAIRGANEVILKKFGANEHLELTRNHRRRHN